MLTYFWLTHTNDVFFNYFRFNWVPPMELQEKVREKINNINKNIIDIEIPFLKPLDVDAVIARNEMLNAAKINEEYLLNKETIKKYYERKVVNEKE